MFTEACSHFMSSIIICRPSDSFSDQEEVQNCIAIYEFTIKAFKAAVDVMSGVQNAPEIPAVGITKPVHDTKVLSSSDPEEIQRLWHLWRNIFPSWPISIPRLAKLLDHSHCKCLIHEQGFCLAYLFDGGMGKISAIGVVPEFRNKGIGTALITRAREELDQIGEVKSFGIGSVFPRFWAGVPFDVPQVYQDFFLHRGFRKSTEATARDLYRDITVDIATPALLEKVSHLPLTFSPLTPDLYEECMRKQVANFGHNKAWVEAYRRLANASQYQEVMVACSSVTGEQVGWTLMCSASSIVADDFAFLPLCPSGDKTGLIACVGVDKSARKKGVGLALLVKAMEDLKRRGCKGVLIDWVVIRGFYENLGFHPIWEFYGYD